MKPRAVPGGTKDPRNRCQRRGSSYTKWVKVGNPFWGWSTASLSLSLSIRTPCSSSLSCLHRLVHTNTMESCAVSLSIERGECSCAMHVQQPQPRRPRRFLRPGLAWPWSRLINRIPMMTRPIRIIIRGDGHWWNKQNDTRYWCSFVC